MCVRKAFAFNWIITGLIVGLVVISLFLGILNNVFTERARADANQQFSDIYAHANTLCDASVGEMTYHKAEIPDIVEAIYVTDDVKTYPDDIDEKVTSHETAVGRYLCMKLVEEKPKCKALKCTSEVSYLGQKKTVISLADKILKRSSSTGYSLTIERYDDGVVVLSEDSVAVNLQPPLVCGDSDGNCPIGCTNPPDPDCISESVLPSGTVGIWEVYEIDLMSTNTYSNPYVDVQLNAVFTGPIKAITMDGFWDGGQDWKLRMAPSEVGTWTYTTTSNDAELNGKTGAFTVIESGKKGFVIRDPSNTFAFKRTDGGNVFWMGDTCWNCMSNVGGAFPLATYKAYINNRADQKFNFIRSYVVSLYSGSTDDTFYNEGGRAFDPWNPDRLNPGYFQEADKRIEHANSKGITMNLVLGADRNLMTDFFGWGNGKMERYIRYIAARYSAYDIAWEGRAEFEEQGGTPGAVTLANQIGVWLDDHDPYGHVQSMHTLNSNNELGGKNWLDWIMHQGVDWNLIVSDRHYNKPVMNEEFYYEDSGAGATHNHMVDADTVREGAWYVMTYGATGLAYGNTGTLNARSMPFAGIGYSVSDGADYMTHLYNFWSMTGYWKLAPHSDLKLSGTAYLVADPGNEYVAYLPSGGSVTLDLSDVSTALPVRWYNPRTGQYQGETTVLGGPSRTFTAPDTNDWVLHIKAETSPVNNVDKYDIFEVEVNNAQAYSNPFDYNEIELQATFTSPSGNHIPFFGFYDGNGNGGQIGDVWKLRFMPDETGIWDYTYTWTDGTSGGSGSFNVVDTGLPGPLKIAADNPWYLSNSRGEPFDWRGYNMHLWKHWSSQPFNNLMSDHKTAVNAQVIPNRYNAVMILGPGYRSNGGHNWWDGSSVDRFDITTWTNWDKYINNYRSNEIYVFPFSLIAQWDVNTVGSAQIKQFYHYFVARNAAYYNLFGYSLTWEWPEKWSEADITGWMSDSYTQNPFSALLSSHDSMLGGFSGWGGLSMRQQQSNDIFDGNSRTAGQHGGVQGSFVNKPIIASEDTWIDSAGTYNQPRNADESRRGMWGAALAGILPLYSEWDGHSPDADGTGEADAIYMYDFLYSNTDYRQYQQLNNLVSSSARQICSGILGQEYLVYDENGGSITIDLSGTSSAKSFSVLWFDPKTGGEQNMGTINGGASRTLTPPFSGDVVLHLTLI